MARNIFRIFYNFTSDLCNSINIGNYVIALISFTETADVSTHD